MLPFLYAAFILSGAAGLIYESIWTRYLGLFVGHSAYAQVIVLVIFLGGMSVGALAVGRRSERVAHPLLWYAGVELATGIIGLVFHDAFVATTDFAYASIFPAFGLGAAQTIAKWGIASLLILPQSILLGMTFPLMSADVVRRAPERSGRTLSMLYFANSLGAAAGVLVAGFFLVSYAGLPGTLLIAAIINIVVAVAVFVGLRARRDPAAEHAAPVVRTVGTPVSGLEMGLLWRLLLLVSFGTALSSFIYEIGWIRMLALVLGSATHSFELMLSAFILGLALGAFWIRRRADAFAGSLRVLGLVQLAMGSLAIATLPVYLASFHWMAELLAAFTKTNEGYQLFNIARYAICLAVMLPATFCAGMTLPLITRVLVGAGAGERAIGQVYGVNTFGSIVGAGVAGLLLLPILGLKGLLVAGALVDLALGIVLLALHLRAARAAGQALRLPTLALATGVAAAVAIIAVRSNFDHTVLASGVYRYGLVERPGSRKILYYQDGRTATVAVRGMPDNTGMTLLTNGKPDASLSLELLDSNRAVRPGPFIFDTPTQLFVPLVALAHAPRAREAAVIGFGSGMTSHTLLGSSALSHLVTIEIEPEMIRASRHFYPANRRAYDDKRSSFVIDDARSYFAARRQRFDLIVSEPSNPWVSGVSGLFTTEFYGRIRGYLTDDGIFAQWLHLYEIDDALVLGVIAALSRHFPAYSIYQISEKDILIVATAGATLPQPDWSIFQIPAIASDLRYQWPVTAQTMETLHIADARSLAPLVRMTEAPNSDFYPVLDLNAERTRYMKSEALGFEGLNGGRVNFAAMVDGRRNGFGDPYAVVTGVPRLAAMAANVAGRQGDPRGGVRTTLVQTNRRILNDAMAAGKPPVDWRVWVQLVAGVDEALHGGTTGVADTAFYASVRSYLARASAPPRARAAIDFLHGLSAWDFAESARAADTLLAAAAGGEVWLDGDVLRDGTVISRLMTGDRAGAEAAYRLLLRRSTRSASDLRTRLLYSYVADKGGVGVVAARH
jgi:spermidine synthase